MIDNILNEKIFKKKKQATKANIYIHVVTMKKFIISLYFDSSFLLHGIFINITKTVQKFILLRFGVKL